MERLWSPWRMEYIQANKDSHDEDRGCVFCLLLAGELTDQTPPLRIEEHAYVSLAKYPYNPGHLVVMPTRHTADIQDLRADESAAIAALTQRCVRVLAAASDPHGFNIGLNLGRVAGAGIPEHLHWHVVPRWGGDSNFMPIVGQTRVLPELLEQTHAKLAPLFEED